MGVLIIIGAMILGMAAITLNETNEAPEIDDDNFVEQKDNDNS